MASFRRVVLGQPEIAAIVFEFQFGVYEDVRPAFLACHELLEYESILNVYECDASFAASFAPTWLHGPTLFHASTYALQQAARDARLPLHLAVAEGFAQLAKRIVRCRPDLASDDAMFLALSKGHFEMAEFLLEQQPIASHRGHPSTHSAGPTQQRPRNFPKGLLLQLLRREDVRGLVLLQRLGLHPSDFSPSDIRMAMQSSTLANATLALDLFPWFHYPRLLDDMAGRSFLPLVH
ncbi:hypothetical protein SPRG_06416 [Saprolegnia parasitica CBS 223.65]|uniref:Uncharacterized protein n=1 Tax=Saprolegnia parasitica (strain CBS 223.65) TaxID=695850 RepID=A0A067CDH7_SAPPC|nr:hypothetical protein SPRG_06416 [Saprolegnia parasitica CBS 223.65]KDO28558.1 hypothetical protein SPRG_06416 [Saprolegnia parasitica CBS 223.65]|eukprot:XP_012200623.1 hypothetical protein SPRG_06416 [Saprolegnia parasitica CBS 223.65]